MGYKKVVVLGASNAGKTCLIQRIATGTVTDSVATASIAYTRLHLGQQTIDLWDTAGAEKFSPMAELYTRNASCVILVFDQSSSDSFQAAQKLSAGLKPGTNVVLVQNKSDCEAMVADSDVQKFAQEHNYPLFKTSALKGTNVREMFERAAEFELADQDDSDDVISDEPETKSKCCNK